MTIHNSPFARIKKPLKSDMNVVPYIDVMLVLLIIFMVAAPMLTTGVEVNLPKASLDSVATNNLLAVVSLKANGDLYVSENGGKEAQVNQQTLLDTLSASQQKSSKFNVLIRADENNQYGQVMLLMSTLNQAGIKKVGLLTEAPRK